MPLANYGAENPNATDPWQIESTLAPIALGGDQMQAQGMLDSYRLQRQAANNAYQQNLEGQHDFAYQQLAQQMKEAYLKAIPENAKAGTLATFASVHPQAFAGGDPGILSGDIARLQQGEEAKTFQAGATGLNQASQGGYELNPQQVPGVAGMQTGPYQGAALVQAARIKAASAAALANIDRTKPPTGTVSGQIGLDDQGNYVQQSYTRVPVGGEGPYRQMIRDANEDIQRQRSGQPPLPSTPPPTPPGKTPLKVNPNAAASGTPAARDQKIDTNSPLGQKAQSAAKIKADQVYNSGDPQVPRIKADIDATSRGGVYNVVKRADGKVGIQGRQNFYPLDGVS